jgi:hypothetical protein
MGVDAAAWRAAKAARVARGESKIVASVEAVVDVVKNEVEEVLGIQRVDTPVEEDAQKQE